MRAANQLELNGCSNHNLFQGNNIMAAANSTRRHPSFKDLTGKRFGKWTVIAEDVSHPSKVTYWLCRCECGTEKSVYGVMLTENRSRSCIPCSKRQHGMCNTPEYDAWQSMKGRCYNSNSKAFPAYGGNGKVVCDRWLSFENFYADMGLRPSASHSVDRIDNSKGYSPENCRWATPKEQSLNRSCVRLLTFNGITQSIPDWAKQIGISHTSLRSRLKHGWTIELALTAPSGSHVQMIEFNGKTMCLAAWSTEVGIKLGTLHDRLKRGWTIERALTEPVKGKS